MHFCAQRVANPLHRFLDQFVERDDRQFKMLLLRVLHLVVTDAVQALHKHHDGGNARAHDLGSVVERTGRKTANRFDLPDPIPIRL